MATPITQVRSIFERKDTLELHLQKPLVTLTIPQQPHNDLLIITYCLTIDGYLETVLRLEKIKIKVSKMGLLRCPTTAMQPNNTYSSYKKFIQGGQLMWLPHSTSLQLMLQAQWSQKCCRTLKRPELYTVYVDLAAHSRSIPRPSIRRPV